MKTIGELLKETRLKKKLSKERLEKETKIKISYIDSLEKSQWERLPEYPVVVGFVKNLAASLGVNEKQALAVLRRDYPPKVLRISPKPDVGNRFTWSPKLTFILGAVLLCLLALSYLTFQYIHFIQPPKLSLEVPQDAQVVKVNVLTVKGMADSEATVTVNNQPTILLENGEFTTQIEIFAGTEEIVVVAKSRTGKGEIWNFFFNLSQNLLM